MHLHVIWDTIKGSRLVQAGVLLVIFSGLAELCDQLGAVDLSAVPYLGHYSPAILATVGLAKVIFRALAVILSALKTQEPTA
jgi:hypothetical protein